MLLCLLALACAPVDLPRPRWQWATKGRTPAQALHMSDSWRFARANYGFQKRLGDFGHNCPGDVANSVKNRRSERNHCEQQL